MLSLQVGHQSLFGGVSFPTLFAVVLLGALPTRGGVKLQHQFGGQYFPTDLTGPPSVAGMGLLMMSKGFRGSKGLMTQAAISITGLNRWYLKRHILAAGPTDCPHFSSSKDITYDTLGSFEVLLLDLDDPFLCRR